LYYNNAASTHHDTKRWLLRLLRLILLLRLIPVLLLLILHCLRFRRLLLLLAERTMLEAASSGDPLSGTAVVWTILLSPRLPRLPSWTCHPLNDQTKQAAWLGYEAGQLIRKSTKVVEWQSYDDAKEQRSKKTSVCQKVAPKSAFGTVLRID
jgi:hypothetical protein